MRQNNKADFDDICRAGLEAFLHGKSSKTCPSLPHLLLQVLSHNKATQLFVTAKFNAHSPRRRLLHGR